MQRRKFLQFLGLLGAPALSGCGFQRIDPMHVLVRSDVIESMQQEAQILKQAKLEWTLDGRIRVLYQKGSPYERGYQHGKLLRREVQDNLNFLYNKAVDKFHFEELFDEAYERIRPFIPQEYVEEMHGLAHGAKIPLHVVHGIHALPSIGEWGGKKRIKEVVKQMMNGELATSCSNFAVEPRVSGDGSMYVVRVLDWGLHRVSKLHEYPLLNVVIPDKGNPYLNIGWVGFLGAISGVNAAGITLGEMGYGDPPGETMRGKPMLFLLRDILSYANNLKDVRKIISQSPGDQSFVYLISDGKTSEAELYVRDRNRFVVHEPGKLVRDGENVLKPLADMIYGGHYNDKLYDALNAGSGQITPQYIMSEIVPKVVMNSNFQNVIYKPADLKIWVNNAKSKTERAAEQPWTFFDFGLALKEWRAESARHSS